MRVALLAAGSNAGGQLGIGSLDDAHTLQPCPLPPNEQDEEEGKTDRILDLSSGANHTVCIRRAMHDRHGRLYACGYDDMGQLGGLRAQGADSTCFQRLSLAQLTHDTDLDGAGSEDSYPVMVRCGWLCTYLVIRRSLESQVYHDEHLYVLGRVNDFGVLGTSASIENTLSDSSNTGRHRIDLSSIVGRKGKEVQIEALAAGLQHCLVMCAWNDEEEEEAHVQSKTQQSQERQHALVGWGMRRHGQLGPHEALLKKSSDKGKWTTPTCLARWTSSRQAGGEEEANVQLAAGNRHSILAVPNNWTTTSPLWGGGGVPSITPYIERQVGKSKVYAFGDDAKCQLAVLNKRQMDEEAISLEGVACTWFGTFLHLKRQDGTSVLVASGKNTSGQLGAGHCNDGSSKSNSIDVEQIRLPPDMKVKKLVAGSEHCLAVIEDAEGEAKVYGWGWNEHGNLGQSHQEDCPLPVSLSAPTSFKPVDVWAGCATTFVEMQERV